ncbi:uncharacterized protein LOC132722619 [Ruditapes philippinarum]|uniref:uncharacterized protein LOC132722619 n=1 Tax=Ruditapes philippinarum TaxID=129788 RepID=UPI00295A996E|nr:uncharacterized protein LOC132722619 [Ruditapes philippinarum]
MEEIKKTLSQYPSSFNVQETIAAFSREELEKIRHKLEIELESSEKEFSTDMEKLRVENLMSFLHYHLGDREKATQFNKKVLDTEPENMIALSNKAWFSLRDRKNILQCKEQCDRLKVIKRQNQLACLMARAEVAFTYSRLGIRNYQKASSEFEKVLQDCNTIKTVGNGPNSEDNSTPVPIDYCCVWMYGKALCQQRLSNLHNMYDLADIEKQKNSCSLTLDILSNIVGIKDSESACIKRYKARSFIEIGWIAYEVSRNKYVFPKGMEEFMPPNSPLLMPPTNYFMKALEYYQDDVFVLERSGKYFRYINELEKSIDLLLKAIQIKPTSFGYHHIALSFKRLLEFGDGALARKLQEIPLDCQQGSVQSDKTDEDATEVSETHFEHSKGDSIGLFTTMSSSKFNNIAAGNPTTIQMQFHETNTRMSDNNNHKPRSSYRTRIHNNYRSTVYKSHNQMFKAYRGQNVGIPFFETPVQPNNKETHVTRQSSDAAVDYLTGTFSQLDINPQRGNAITFPVYGHYNSRTFRDRSQRYDRRPYNRCSYKRFCNRVTNSPCGPSRQKSKIGIKCPKKPISIDYNEHKPVVDKVIAYLDKAFEMSSNTVAIYDKAILYRQISQPENALKVLDNLLQVNDQLIPKIMLANIYEQSAFCINDMFLISDDINMNKRRDMEEDRDFYLKSSIEISCALINKIPSLHNCWKSAATLRNVLYDKLEIERTKDTLKELRNLYKKLNDHFDAIKILKELQTLADNEEEEKEFLEGIVEHQLSMGNYEEAVIALCMSKQLRDGQPIIKKDLYIKAYIEAGLNAFTRKHYQKGNMRIREAFRFVRESQQIPKNSEASNETNIDAEENESFDLFILSNLDDDENGRKLMMLLDNFGLKTTFNTDSPAITPGTPEVTGMTNIMNRSNAFVILKDFETDNKTMQHIIDRMQNIVENRQHKTLILVVTLQVSTETQPGSFYATQKTITIDLKSVSEDTLFAVVPEGVKSLLMALASV